MLNPIISFSKSSFTNMILHLMICILSRLKDDNVVHHIFSPNENNLVQKNERVQEELQTASKKLGNDRVIGVKHNQGSSIHKFRFVHGFKNESNHPFSNRFSQHSILPKLLHHRNIEMFFVTF